VNVGDRVIGVFAPGMGGGKVVEITYRVLWDGEHHVDDYPYSPDELEPIAPAVAPLEVAARPGKGQAAEPTNSVRSAA